ncbi:ATP-dependent RNA helicase dbp10 [Drechslerella stenobrocha 248]|uniref:RNA helicase n=1 Tax=Drechslerella stenobrocha 248 TaxID=1043628 RepID=W7HQD2_9PEZI|nr:ATP-dependent RNA helicase dbp10 [Drechslerella stenobrocha 248]
MAPDRSARAASPAADEADMDITSALTGTVSFMDDDDDDGFGFAEPPKKRLKPQKTLDASSILDLDKASDNGSDSEADDKFIKSQLASANRKASNIKSKSLKKSGGFQSMGLNATLLKAIQRKGFSVPTPIQRKTIPLLLDGQDVVGMARTGSGKTAAFIIPMVEKLKAHSAKVGARGLILSPSRELALQTLKVVKDLLRGTDLKAILLVGGDSLEDQFSMMTTNPDIIIATPGRFLHLKVEMELDLGSMQYVVFDEADRLFEMGFAAQLGEILHALPANRQTTLFSATLPKSLVEFAKAGLHEPSLVRLDADSKVSTELETAFFTVKSEEKEGALLQILQDLINVPMATSQSASRETQTEGDGKKKRKRFLNLPKNELSNPHSTIIFASTKHHVEYLANLLKAFGYAVSYVYGTLDQVARRNQVDMFRSGESQILVVTDVAARGIDIPMLSNVINYDFPPQPKVFVHRVGRTARAGRRGWAYSIVRLEDMPYLLDLQLFLGRKLVTDGASSIAQGKRKEEFDFANDIIVGALKRDALERCTEAIIRVVGASHDLAAMKEVAARGEKLYQKTKAAASTESVKRSKEIVAGKDWMSVNPIFADEVDVMEIEKADMLKRLANYRPQETVFEIGQRGVSRSEGANVMKSRRQKIKIKSKTQDAEVLELPTSQPGSRVAGDDDEEMGDAWEDMDEDAPEASTIEVDMSSADEDELETVFKTKRSKASKAKSFQDPDHYMAYTPTTSLAEDRGYSVTNSFAEAARSATMDLVNDDGNTFGEQSKRGSGLRWDSKTKKFVNRRNDDDGSRGGPKMIRGESGQKIAASFKSGRFEGWKKANKLSRLPKVGEMEGGSVGSSMPNKAGFGGGNGGRIGGRMFHKKVAAPKQADKARDDYHVRKKRVEEAKAKGLHGKGYGKRVGSEVKSNVQIAKDRRLKEKRMEKNARPSRKGRK